MKRINISENEALRNQLIEARTKVKSVHPLVHNITNYVTVNDCANILLSANASPIMSDDLMEVEEITSICGALVLNIGTLNERTIKAMLLAGKKASELGHPIVLDPVGAGASKLRTNTALALIEALDVTVIRGNISELKALYLGDSSTQGVDANDVDAISEKNLEGAIKLVNQMAKHFGTIIAVTGAIDIVTNGEEAYVIKNGHEKMKYITGTGCMLTSLIGAYVRANSENPVLGVAAVVSLMGSCGELAWSYCDEHKLGTGTMKTRLIDLIGSIDDANFASLMKIERVELDKNEGI
ncbi:hydroxyethylthiazole kinase [Fusibacter bizertensis]|uniref:Hydroxyethylthiazole kinase n=1 Tax=Fusibacter bizertensis TaxID=1488331 RepID=A0ABT6N7Y7_9FIRM|nr:hydroxyethylthiazole kinase [Fusibacter bizertensis]MDH8676512.1 hydroxyethylthiazole kinase [Fusibacter bizertensis]